MPGVPRHGCTEVGRGNHGEALSLRVCSNSQLMPRCHGMKVLNIKIRIAFSINGQSTELRSLRPVPNSRRLIHTAAGKMLDPRRCTVVGENGKTAVKLNTQACADSLITQYVFRGIGNYVM